MTSTVTQHGTAAATTTEKLGAVARRIAIIAAAGSILASIIVGAFLGPLEVKSSEGLSGLEQGLLVACFVGLASQVVWLGLGLWALIQGIFAVTSSRGRRQGQWAIWLAVGVPLVSFGVFVGLTLLVSPLG